MIKIVYCGYRKWSFDILKNLVDAQNERNFRILSIVTAKEKESNFTFPGIKTLEINPPDIGKGEVYEKLKLLNPDLFLFYGWSWMVPKNILALAKCVCLHPSPLPRYRGGSPLQHQIIKDEQKSAVTLFYISEGLDSGDILIQKPFSLDGELSDIFKRIANIGTSATLELFDKIDKGSLRVIPQDDSKATIYKRRKPEESEIKMEYFKKKTAVELHNFIKALQDPYPNAYVVCKDKKRLYILKTRVEK